MTTRSSFLKTIGAALVLALAGGNASAQAWPNKPVRIVLGAPAGTAPDAAARILGERLGALWGQPVVIDNRPGAGGTLAMEYVRAATDGVTIMFAHSGAVVITPKFLKAAKYDPVNDFTTLGLVADSPMMIVATSEGTEKNLADMLKVAKANPGKIALGSTEQSTLPFLVGHNISQLSGATFLHVPFNNPSQAAQALGKGDVQYHIDGIAPLMPLIKGGRAKAIALTTDKPLPGLENVPLAKDTLPGFVAVGWFAMLAPKNMPADVAAKFNQDLNQVLGRPEVAAKLHDISLFPRPLGQAESAAFIKAEVDRWAGIIKKVGIEPM